jgi:hypothetical protein
MGNKHRSIHREIAEKIIESRKHPEQGFRSCMGLIRLEKRYGKERLNAACLRAFESRAYSYRSVESILKNNLDNIIKVDDESESVTKKNHENIRGGEYFK